jgi:hypothetical protein
MKGLMNGATALGSAEEYAFGRYGAGWLVGLM